MQRIEHCVVALLLTLSAPFAGAQVLSVSGNPSSLTVSTATAGLGLDPVVDASTTYSVTTTLPNQKIVARLTTALPSGVILKVRLQPPSGVTALGDISLTTTNADVVGPIPVIGPHLTLSITYTLSALVTAGTVSTTGRDVVFSVVAGP
ncbi:MAG: hypothetical protein WD825_11690 [Gemmatimonadaceae bacterium]